MGKRIRQLLVALLVGGLLVVVGPTAVAWSGASGRKHDRVADVESRDVVLVLGAGVLPNGSPSTFLKGRLDLAADLYQAGKAKVILVSGDNTEKYYNEPEAMRRYLHEQRGVPVEDVVADYAGIDTFNSCARARQIFGVSTLTIISQAYHLPRAITTCRMLGVDAQGLGDTSVRERRAWRAGELREVPANMKMIFDVIVGRDPILGPPEDGVTKALRRPR